MMLFLAACEPTYGEKPAIDSSVAEDTAVGDLGSDSDGQTSGCDTATGPYQGCDVWLSVTATWGSVDAAIAFVLDPLLTWDDQDGGNWTEVVDASGSAVKIWQGGWTLGDLPESRVLGVRFGVFDASGESVLCGDDGGTAQWYDEAGADVLLYEGSELSVWRDDDIEVGTPDNLETGCEAIVMFYGRVDI